MWDNNRTNPEPKMILTEIVKMAKKEGLSKDVNDCIHSLEKDGIGKFQFYNRMFLDDYCMLNPETNECPLQVTGETKGLCECAGGEYRQELTNPKGFTGWSLWYYK